MRGLKIITVGRIRKGFAKEAFSFYLKKIEYYCQVEVLIVRDIREDSIPLRLEKEAGLILERVVPKDQVIVLDRDGKAFCSEDFSSRLERWQEDPGRFPCFIIGGAYGLSDRVKSRADLLMSLGPMTLPHELATVVLMEQIYRGHTILGKHPYHH